MNDRPWLLYAIAACAAVLLYATWKHIGHIEGFSNELRESSVASCERQNEVRIKLNDTTVILRTLVEASLDTGPPETPAEERATEVFRASVAQLTELRVTDCETVIPEQ